MFLRPKNYVYCFYLENIFKSFLFFHKTSSDLVEISLAAAKQTPLSNLTA